MFASGQLAVVGSGWMRALASASQPLHSNSSVNYSLANKLPQTKKNDLPKKIVLSWATWIRTLLAK